jgi:hypothetical protein
MLTYETLSTEKLWLESAKKEIKAHRREQNKAAIRSLFHFFFGLAVIFAVTIAIRTMPMWLPTVSEQVTMGAAYVQDVLRSLK